jgi:hypothetical protein
MNMLRSTFLVLSLAIVDITIAQLAPQRSATTGEHLIEVNAEWSSMDPAMLDNEQVVSFTSEAERIAEHLHRVAERLAARPPKVNAWEIVQRRRILLDTLNAYAARGRFPLNADVPGRTPVFIDEAGTACAVGQLMISSGYAELAARIHQEKNHAYIHGIALPEVAEWATAHGFTTDELAWIQPTYDHMRFAQPGLVASFVMTNGDRIEVQGPRSSDAAQKLRLVRINERATKTVANLPMLTGVQACEYNGSVFVGGRPSTKGPSAEVYEWNGKALVAHDPFEGIVDIVALYVANGTLHVLGYTGPTGNEDRFLREDGTWAMFDPTPVVVPPTQVLPE